MSEHEKLPQDTQGSPGHIEDARKYMTKTQKDISELRERDLQLLESCGISLETVRNSYIERYGLIYKGKINGRYVEGVIESLTEPNVVWVENKEVQNHEAAKKLLSAILAIYRLTHEHRVEEEIGDELAKAAEERKAALEEQEALADIFR